MTNSIVKRNVNRLLLFIGGTGWGGGVRLPSAIPHTTHDDNNVIFFVAEMEKKLIFFYGCSQAAT